MKRWIVGGTIAACLAGLVAACFGGVLGGDRQFSFRDAGAFYYPLYHRVQAEWATGRWPLWDDGENGGMPLLGNPTAAVLYPPKLALFAAVPFPWAMRLYAVGHVLLACGGVFVLVRGWGTSGTGAAVAAVGYGFSGPMLSLTANIIFLVGAAWLPWGLWGADRWVRRGRRDGVLILAGVLALQVLGGDPEAAYLLGLAACGLAWAVARAERPTRPGGTWRRWLVRAVAAGGLLFVAAAEAARRVAAYGRAGRLGGGGDRGIEPVAAVAALAWGALGLALVAVAWRGRRTATAGRVRGLVLAAGLAGLVAAVQIVPAIEFARLSDRGSEINELRDVYAFSVEPQYLPGLVWPNSLGTIHLGSRSWIESVVNLNNVNYPWFPSLYPGLLVVVLGLASLQLRGREAVRTWLTLVVVVGLLAGLGKFAGPMWWLRWLPAVAARVGPHDPPGTEAFRPDGAPLDAWGCPYWVLVHLLPGFGSFRYPAKVIPLAGLALCALAGLGWDRAIAAGRSRRAAVVAGLALGATVVVAAGVEWRRADLLDLLRTRVVQVTPIGPLDALGAVATIRGGLLHAMLALGGVLALMAIARRGRAGVMVGVLGLVGLALDLAVANRVLVISSPQATFDAQPAVVVAIERAERAEPSAGPFRVHRLAIWNPDAWMVAGDPSRLDTIARWEADTLLPKYGLLWGLDYVETYGVAELEGYHRFFDPFRHTANARGAALLGIEPGRKVVVVPRRGFDLWTTRYFITPANPRGWTDPSRAYATLLEGTDQVEPSPDAFGGPGGDQRRDRYVREQDFQVLRNRNAFPRAWVVHDARFDPPRVARTEADQIRGTLEMLHQADALWTVPRLPVEDLRRVAHVAVEPSEQAALASRLSRRPTAPGEAPTITRHEPGHVEIDVTLQSPGMVILADVIYPGWNLTVDGVDAPILRVNDLMRGTAVAAGRHHLVYRYQPRSVAVGGMMSVAGLGLMLVAGWAWRNRRLGQSSSSS